MSKFLLFSLFLHVLFVSVYRCGQEMCWSCARVILLFCFIVVIENDEEKHCFVPFSLSKLSYFIAIVFCDVKFHKILK